MELARRNRRVSDICNEIIGESWRHCQQEFSQMPTSQKNDELCDSIAEYNTEKTDVQYDIKEVKAGVKHPGNLKPQVYNSMTTKRPMATAVDFGSTPVEEIDPFDRKDYFSSGDEAVMRILSSPLFSAFSSKSEISWNLLQIIANAEKKLYERLAKVLQRPPYSTGLVEILFKRTTIDEWLHGYIQTEDFDGTWVAIICGFYQSLYLYDTQIVGKHHLSGLSGNERIVVLLLRLQHLQIFQRIVANMLQKHPSPQDIELLGSQEFLNSCLLDSLRETMNVLQRWEGHVLSHNCHKCISTFPCSHERLCLAHFLPRLLDTEHDIWLWKHLHQLNETPYSVRFRRAPLKSTLITSLCQGLYLYEKNNNHTKAKEIAEGKLTALLFRSQHLVYFEDMLSLSVFFTTNKVEVLNIVEEHFLRCSHLTNKKVKTLYASFLRSLHLELSLYQKEKNDNLDLSFSHGSINVFLGGIDRQILRSMNIMVEESVDLKLVHALGGLICTLEGESTTSSSGDGLACTSWCIVRHTPTNLFFCVDLKNDAYENRSRILDGESTIDYEGAIKVEITDGKTFVRSLQSDGSSYNGCLEDFVDLREDKKPHPSCAEVALQNLPQSNCLKQANLKCSALHMLALAFPAGNKDYLTLKWGGGAGHIEYSTSLNGQDKGPSGQDQIALRKCTLVYTNEGKLVGEDVIWEGDGPDPQDRQSKRTRRIGENNEEKKAVEDESEKTGIIVEHSKLWSCSGLMGIHRFESPSSSAVRARLISAREEAEAELVSDARASVSAQSKQNTGCAIGFATFKGQVHHEHRSQEANDTIHVYHKEQTLVRHLKSTVVVPGDLYNDDFSNLKVLLTSGRIKQHPGDFFIVKAKGSCSLQVFLCNPQDPSQGFIWLTDVVLPSASDAENVFSDKLNGLDLTISRTNSALDINGLAQNFIWPVRRMFQSQQKTFIEKSMILGTELSNFPHSGDGWRFIIGDQSKYYRGNYFFKATESQAIVCSATIYTTGSAIVRVKKQILDESQTSTSSSSHASASSSSHASGNSSSDAAKHMKWHVHGSCRKVCTEKFEIVKDRVTVTGKFSKFKGVGQWQCIHWG